MARGGRQHHSAGAVRILVCVWCECFPTPRGPVVLWLLCDLRGGNDDTRRAAAACFRLVNITGQTTSRAHTHTHTIKTTNKCVRIVCRAERLRWRLFVCVEGHALLNVYFRICIFISSISIIYARARERVTDQAISASLIAAMRARARDYGVCARAQCRGLRRTYVYNIFAFVYGIYVYTFQSVVHWDATSRDATIT